MMSINYERDGHALNIGDVLASASPNQPNLDPLWPFSVQNTESQGWRLLIQAPGRLMWRYLPTEEERHDVDQSQGARYFLGLPTNVPQLEKPTCPSEAAYNSTRFFGHLQTKNGCWGTDMSCIFFVTPMLIMAWYITGAEIPEAHAIALVNYAFAIQNEDGGWPTYTYGSQSTTLMGTLLMYVALRLLGFKANHERMVRGRESLLSMGGAVLLPCWAKFWLCLLGLYKWEGSDPYPAEMWLLPRWVPINPWRWFCIPRQTYLCMAYLWTKKFIVPTNPLLDQIREEIFADSFSSVDFASSRGIVKVFARHITKSWILNVINWILSNIYIPFFRSKSLARRGEEHVLELIRLSDMSSNSTGLISVDCFLSMICIFAAEGHESKNVPRMQENSFEYLWMNPAGLQVMSIPGAHTWEASFALQTMVLSGMADKPECKDVMQQTYNFLIKQQQLEDWKDSPPTHRFSRIGGWPFMAKHGGYSCSDCTGEALKAILLAKSRTDLVEPARANLEENIRMGIDNLLMVQNKSGGYSSFEPIQGSKYLELINGTELFGDVMVEYDYVECTGSAIEALALFQSLHEYRARDVQKAINQGIHFLLKAQRGDGSWVACWGIGFTYSAFFALTALAAVGKTFENSPEVRRGCEFLLSKQKEDGGWGEAIESVFEKVYTQVEQSHTTQTAWALLALISAQYPEEKVIGRGIRLIMDRQHENGQWVQEEAVGCGILTCQLQYHSYIYSFPTRALSMYAKIYGEEGIGRE